MSKVSPKVSIILPAYNAELFIAQTLDSLLAQTFSDFELIVINDASTDSTGDILNSYATKDSRIKILPNEFEKGLVGGLNTALKHSIGEYIARADADDIHRKDRLKLQVEFLDSNKDYVMVGGGFAPFNKNGHLRNILHPASAVELAWRLVANSFFCHPTVMFRRTIFETYGGYPKEKSEDFVYFSSFIKTNKCSNIRKILVDYREHETNLSKLNAAGITSSVNTQFYKNYLYYIPNNKFVEEFYNFQEKKILRPSRFFAILMINQKILNKIRSDYKLSHFSFELNIMRLKVVAYAISAIYNRYFKKL